MGKTKILSIGENCKILNSFRIAFKKNNEQYSFVLTDYESFLHTRIEYNILLFILNLETINSIKYVYAKSNFISEPPIILVCEDDVTEDQVFQIPFKNKLVFKASSALEELKFNISIILKKVELENKIRDFENRVGNLNGEINNLKLELNYNKINLQELSETNNHLVSATWREREVKNKILNELEEVKRENEFNKINITELSVTNDHLVSATFREREMRKQLNDALEDLNKSQKVIEDQNRRISQSINYSKNIQEALNPDNSVLTKHFTDSSILYLPKDIISGDFPWLFKKNEYIYVAAVDCTGHGVPGAMMSIIGNLLLNSIVEDEKVLLPGEILDRLHKRIVITLKQDSSEVNSNDGMDMALVRINTLTNELVYAGSHRPLLYYSKSEGLKDIKGDKFSIGGMHYERKRLPFSNTSVNYSKDDFIIMFSDGLCDQIGGDELKKLGMTRFTEFIEQNKNLSMPNFGNACNQFIENWKHGCKQVDDIIMIAIRF